MNQLDVIKFWFDDTKPEKWFEKDEKFDQLIKDQFLETHTAAINGELDDWRNTALGRLAEIIVIDQFSRNIYRDQPQSFLYDPMGLTLAQEAIRAGVHEQLISQKRAFIYMPFMHSESLLIHNQALQLFREEGLEYHLEFEKKHREIIEKFGRYPHRNKILGRKSTKEETEFLKENPGF